MQFYDIFLIDPNQRKLLESMQLLAEPIIKFIKPQHIVSDQKPLLFACKFSTFFQRNCKKD